MSNSSKQQELEQILSESTSQGSRQHKGNSDRDKLIAEKWRD